VTSAPHLQQSFRPPVRVVALSLWDIVEGAVATAVPPDVEQVHRRP
jgi:hypothetical protein